MTLGILPCGSAGRIAAMILRYWYLLRGSWPRFVELAYWPTVNMVLWGFLNQFMSQNSTWVAHAAGVLIASVLLWDILFRSQLGVSICFLEEMWSRNLGHLFVSPLRPGEWASALMFMSLLRTVIGVLPAMVLAIPMFGYSVFTMGLPLAAFFANLVLMGWWMGLLIVALVLRFGMGAEILAWMLGFVLAPLSAVYYPVAVLPHWLQPVAWALPSAAVFEGMRSVVFGSGFRLDLLAWAFGLNAIYMAVGLAIFFAGVHSARTRGALLQTGE